MAGDHAVAGASATVSACTASLFFFPSFNVPCPSLLIRNGGGVRVRPRRRPGRVQSSRRCSFPRASFVCWCCLLHREFETEAARASQERAAVRPLASHKSNTQTTTATKLIESYDDCG